MPFSSQLCHVILNIFLAENKMSWLWANTEHIIQFENDDIDVRVPCLWMGLSTLMLNVRNASLFKITILLYYTKLYRIDRVHVLVQYHYWWCLWWAVFDQCLTRKERLFFSFVLWTILLNRPHINLNVWTQKMLIYITFRINMKLRKKK